MVKEKVFDAYSFILLFWLIARIVAGSAANYTFEQDVFINYGLRNVTTVSELHCCVACTLDDICESVNYNNADKTCQMNDGNPRIGDIAAKTSIVGWTSFYRQLCRSGWHFYSGSCYKAVTILQNWTTSESHCQDLGGHLVDIQNADEQQFVRALASLKRNEWDEWYWVGLNDRAEEGKMVWSSGAPNMFMTNMTDNVAYLDCLEYNPHGDRWHVFYCEDLDNSICKAKK